MSREDEKSSPELLSDYILALSSKNKTGILNDSKTIKSKLSSTSSWFSTKITSKICIRTLELPFSHLAFRCSSFFMQQFTELNVQPEDAEKITQSIKDKVKTIRELGSIQLVESLSETFYCHLNNEWRKKSYIGIIIIGFLPSKSNSKIKLLCCGHCEVWDPSNFKKLTIKNSQINKQAIKNYIIFRLFSKIGDKRS
eukprot:100790_1